jgi:hypothetical protein
VQGFDFVEVLLERLPHQTGQDRVAVFNFRKLKLRDRPSANMIFSQLGNSACSRMISVNVRSPEAVPRSISTTRRLEERVGVE